jgi:hypothetical protein
LSRGSRLRQPRPAAPSRAVSDAHRSGWHRQDPPLAASCGRVPGTLPRRRLAGRVGAHLRVVVGDAGHRRRVSLRCATCSPPDEFERAWQAGQHLDLDRTMALATAVS